MFKKRLFSYFNKIKTIIKKTNINNSYSLSAYRFGSLFMTSVFYIFGPPNSPIVFKLGVILALFLAVKPSLWLYEGAIKSSQNLFKLVIVETVGIAFLLVPTGGLNSPFIWYALNPVLVAASHLPFYLCWVNMAIYLCISGSISVYRQGFETIELGIFFSENAQTILVFLLITFAFQLHARLTGYLSSYASILKQQKLELLKINSELSKANRVNEEYMKHITCLYESVEAFCSHGHREELVDLLTLHTSILTGGLEVGFKLWVQSEGNTNDVCFRVSDNVDNLKEKKLSSMLENLKNDIRLNSNIPFRLFFDSGEELVCVSIKTTKKYGVLSIIVNSGTNEKMEVLEQRLSFLAKISAVVFERIALEEIANGLKLNEEQNRIADEIHDTVSQRLFSVSYALHSLSNNCKEISPDSIQEQIKFIQKSTNKAARELKEAIYRLSSRKNGKSLFFQNIRCYLNEFACLNNIKVSFKECGSEETLNSYTRIALYRIIREATGNAVKHGKCSQIEVSMEISKPMVLLEIADNGIGFDLEALPNEKLGLGLFNMEKLTNINNGSIKINTTIGSGTVIECIIPIEMKISYLNRGDMIESSLN